MRFGLYAPVLAGLMMIAGTSQAASLDGTQWTTVDENGTPKSVIQFKADGKGAYNGTIVKLLKGATMTTCSTCSGADKNRPLVGLTVVRNLKDAGSNEFNGGEIFDPKNGKTYKMKGKLSNNGQSFEMRGFVGFALIGRSQVWQRAR